MREKLTARRISVNLPIIFNTVSGNQIPLVITVGFDENYQAKEVFCADFKAGSDNQALIMDTCILVSRLLQHGDTAKDLYESMCNPPSLIGQIIAAMHKEQNLAIEAGVFKGYIRDGSPNVDGRGPDKV